MSVQQQNRDTTVRAVPRQDRCVVYVDHRLYESVEHSDIIAQRAQCWGVAADSLRFQWQDEDYAMPLPWTP